ncbi:MAG: SpoIIIAH-like family protein [Clostridia bacterium]|nr:SpoIIIAH-like family protein [Clostridia bacterium]
MMHKKKHEIELSDAPVEEKKPNKFMTFMQKIGKRNFAIAGAVLLIGVAVFLNWVLFANTDPTDGYNGYDQPSGNVSTPNTDTNTQLDETNTYFSATQVSRQRARDEALEVLQAVVDNVDATEAAKTEALAGISAIADEIQKEANIESLVIAKGFEQCVAVLNGESATIVVSADTLQPADLAQINAIVYEQTGILPSGITIVNK